MRNTKKTIKCFICGKSFKDFPTTSFYGQAIGVCPQCKASLKEKFMNQKARIKGDNHAITNFH